ncbi:MAG: hypothetical protein ACKO5M_02870 [Vulcanococcus sp.]
MAVASPYAVFRAADLSWPSASPPLHTSIAGGSTARPARACKRHVAGAGRSQPSAARLATLIQGELFQTLPLG